MRPVLDPVPRYPHASRETPAVGDYVKLHVVLNPQGTFTGGAWYRVTGRCQDGRFRGRGASDIVGPSDEVHFTPGHVIERRPPKGLLDRALAWVLKRDSVPC